MTVPKFNIETKMDLKEKLEGLGVTATEMDSASHGAYVKIDEEGLEAAAYSLPGWTDGGPPDYDVVIFAVDRPFIFVGTGLDGLPLFIGVVNLPR